jgi:hypothetical protein
MKLNKTQRDYAITRLNEKIREKLEAELPKFISSKKDDADALYDLLKSYNVPLIDKKEFRNIWNIRSINEGLIFSDDFDKEYNENQNKRNEIQNKYEALKQEVLDKLYLCDEAEEALSLINSI